MEFRRLTAADLPSLLELYRQLDPEDHGNVTDSEKVWKEIENNLLELRSSIINITIHATGCL